MDFDSMRCDLGDMVALTDDRGDEYKGTLSDIEWDFDGSEGGDSVTLLLEDGEYISFMQDEVVSIAKAD